MRPFHVCEALLYRLETATILISPSCFRVHCNSGTSISLSAVGFSQDRSKHDSSAAGSGINPRRCSPSSALRQLTSLRLPLAARHCSHSHTRNDRARRDNDGSLSTVALIRAIISRLNSWLHIRMPLYITLLPPSVKYVHNQGKAGGLIKTCGPSKGLEIQNTVMNLGLMNIKFGSTSHLMV
jgi:hypothetical protein